MKTAFVAGASGLTGSHLVNRLLESPEYDRVILLVRSSLRLSHPKLVQVEADFDHLSDLDLTVTVDHAFCALGTTLAKAGSKEAFRRVDQHYVLDFAELALKIGATAFCLVSSMGADPKSKFFYPQVKGETEEALKKIPFHRITILRPSLLLGERREKRLAERIFAWIMSRIHPIIPLKYKAIKADSVAEAMIHYAAVPEAGTFTYNSGELLSVIKRIHAAQSHVS
ncbi:MAG: oxidoreductase [Marinilabiliales bacterium]|nr:oxidoreductase [Marinilabiliales bacterium]